MSWTYRATGQRRNMSTRAETVPRSISTSTSVNSAGHSLASLLVRQSTWQRKVEKLSDAEILALFYDWEFWARPNQLPPEREREWSYWLLMAGRGFGKTRTGAEWVRHRVENGIAKRIALVAQTPADGRDVMVEGESGLLAVSPPWMKPDYQPSKRRVVWPNGSVATLYSGYEPDQLRGPQHDTAWCDELAAWQYPRETWDMLQMGMRIGANPQTCVTTTPRPIKVLKEILASKLTVMSRGTTYDNLANLSPVFQDIIEKYKGTTLGQQELMAQLLEEMPGALWSRKMLEATRVKGKDGEPAKPPTLTRIVVAIDPAITAHEESNETGIVSVGLGVDREGYVLRDVSGRLSPDGWAKRAVKLYHDSQADRIVAEANQGGDMVKHTIHTVDGTVPVKLVRATKGKYTRAEPVAALFEQKKAHMVGMHEELEDQLCTWLPGENSPDRLDAMVWGYTELMLGQQRTRGLPEVIK